MEDGTIVNLIGVHGLNPRYKNALMALENSPVFLYDENYDPIKILNAGNINAYVYDGEENCINSLDEEPTSNDIPQEKAPEPTERRPDPIESNESTDQGEQKRISGVEVSKLPGKSLSELYERNKYSVFMIIVPKDESHAMQGTGFFVTSDGIAVSNFHVFEGGVWNQAVVKTIDNHQYRIGKIIKYDKDFDFIVFLVENAHHDFPFLFLAKKVPSVGDDVFAIGNPLGLEHTLSKGIVSSFRKNDLQIQTTAEITHGSSGGPLFNMSGEVIGITTSGMEAADLNFAMNIIKLNLENYIPQPQLTSGRRSR